jgi:regulator of protease activity HflC (stomatin/prohibitin superfamily)
MTIAVVVVVLAGLVLLGVASIRVLREYQRAVVFRLGRVRQLGGPGLIALVPIVDRMIRVDLRTVTLTIPPQEVITRDNVPARVNAVAYFRVTRPPAGHPRGRGVPGRHLPDRADHPAVSARPRRARHPARRARTPQRQPSADHR